MIEAPTRASKLHEAVVSQHETRIRTLKRSPHHPLLPSSAKLNLPKTKTFIIFRIQESFSSDADAAAGAAAGAAATAAASAAAFVFTTVLRWSQRWQQQKQQQ